MTLRGVGLISLAITTQRMNARKGSNPEATGLEPCFSLKDAIATVARSVHQILRETCGWDLIWEKTVGHGIEGRGCVRGRIVSLRIALQNHVSFVKMANI